MCDPQGIAPKPSPSSAVRSFAPMPYDITMCGGGACPQRNECYRFRAISGARQDWFAPPYDPATGRCDSFWDLRTLAPTEASTRYRAYMIYVASGRAEGRSDEHWAQAEREQNAHFEARISPL